ncbi:MAG: family phosphatase [Polaromonas sp.]|nr:family phosphatase [Polaromonas sp.]
MNIVFDFGAVLFTWQPAELVARSFPMLAGTADKARALARSIFHHPDWQAFDCGLTDIETVITNTARRLQLDAQTVRALMTPIGEELAPIAVNIELLEQLRHRRDQQGDVRLYFLSNMPAPYARALERRHAFLQWFDGGIFSGDVKFGKPDPAIYQLLASRYCLEPASTLFVDDMLVNVEAAAAVGWQTIHCQQPDRLPEDMLKKIMPVAQVKKGLEAID